MLTGKGLEIQPLNVTQLTGNSERLQRMPFPYENPLLVPLLVEPYQNFIFAWRFLACLASRDNSTLDHLLTGWGKWKRSPAGSVWQVDRRPGEAVRFPAGSRRAQPGEPSACCLPRSRERGAARLPSWQGERGARRSGCFPFGCPGWARGQEMRFSSH